MKRTRIYGPMVEIGRLQAELNRLFAGILESQGTLPAGASWDPNADVVEEPGELTILVEVPGLSAAELSVGVQGNALVVRGTKRAPTSPAEASRFLCMERFFGEFEKRVPLPVPVNVRRARATLANGVLTIVLPRVEDRRESYSTIAIDEIKGVS